MRSRYFWEQNGRFHLKLILCFHKSDIIIAYDYNGCKKGILWFLRDYYAKMIARTLCVQWENRSVFMGAELCNHGMQLVCQVKLTNQTLINIWILYWAPHSKFDDVTKTIMTITYHGPYRRNTKTQPTCSLNLKGHDPMWNSSSPNQT